MRIVYFLFCLIMLSTGALAQKKVILASYFDTNSAKRGLTEFSNSLSDDFWKIQNELKFESKVRSSGKSFILVLEPIDTYQNAKRVIQALPKKFQKTYPSNYNPPLNPAFVEVAEPKILLSAKKIEDNYKIQEENKQKEIPKIITQKTIYIEEEVKQEEKQPKISNVIQEIQQTPQTTVKISKPIEEIQETPQTAVNISKPIEEIQENKQEQPKATITENIIQKEERNIKDDVTEEIPQQTQKRKIPSIEEVMQAKDEEPISQVIQEEIKPTKEQIQPQVQQQEASLFNTLSLALAILFILTLIIIYILYKKIKSQSSKIYDLESFTAQKDTKLKQLENKLNIHEANIENIVENLQSSTDEIYVNSFIENKENKDFKTVRKSTLKLKQSLDIFALSRGKIEIVRNKFDIIDRLNYMLSTLAEELSSRKNTIILDYDAKYPRVLIGDAKRLIQVLMILIKYVTIRSNNEDVVMSFRKTNESDKSVTFDIEIKNSSINFTKKSLDLMQHAISNDDEIDIRTKEVANIQIAKKIINALRGNIEIVNTKGNGSGFKINMPMHLPETQELRKYRLPEKEMMQYSVLIAESDVQSIGILRRQLEYFHMNVKPSFSWDQAQRMLEGRFYKPDIVFIQSEFIDFIDKEKFLKLHEKKGFSVIFIANNHKIDSFERAKNFGNFDILLKPYTQDVILALLVQIYNKKRAIQETNKV